MSRLLDRAVRADPGGRLPMISKLVLALAVLCVYPSMLVRMRRQGVRETVLSAREPTARDPVGRTRLPEERLLVAWRLGGAVGQTLSILPTDSRCLVQALVLTRLLTVLSVPSRFVIGVRPGPDFVAHAWVECEGMAVLPSRGYGDSRLLEL